MGNKNFIITVTILIIVAITGLSSYMLPATDSALKVKVADFPKTIGGWVSTEIPLSERDYEILETRNLFLRDYKNGKGDSVILYIIYSEDNRKVSHPPEICYMGSGLTIVNKSAIKLTESIKAVKMLAEKADNRQLVIYTLKVGNLYTDSYLRQQLKIVIGRMLGKRIPSALIRLSAHIKNNDEEDALNLIKSFTRQIEPLLAKYVP